VNSIVFNFTFEKKVQCYRGGGGAVDKTHAFGVTNVSLSKTLDP